MTDETRLPGYDAVIPARVRYDPELTDKAKLLYGEIRALASRDGYCWATNAYFCHLYMVSESTIQRNIAALTDRGHIWSEVIRDEETNAVLERRLWVDRARFFARDPDAPPLKNDTTPPRKNEGTPPRKNDGENITRENSTREEDPPVVPPGGRRKKKNLPDWKPERFDAFWEHWPKTQSNANQKKADARRAWNQLRADDELLAYMGEYLKLQMKTDQWRRGVGIPYASTWIRAFGKEELPDMDTLKAITAQGEAAPEAPAEPYTGGLDEAQRQALLYGGD